MRHGKGKKNITNTCKTLLEKLREREFLRLETSGLDPLGSKEGPAEGFCDKDDEVPYFTNCYKCFDQLLN